MFQQKIQLGDLVKLKNREVLKKIGINVDNIQNIPYFNDIGCVVDIIDSETESYITVHWQKLQKQYCHFPETLEVI